MRRKWLGLKKTGGEGGIRTLGTGVSPYNGLANRRIRPLCHLSGECMNGPLNPASLSLLLPTQCGLTAPPVVPTLDQFQKESELASLRMRR